MLSNCVRHPSPKPPPLTRTAVNADLKKSLLCIGFWAAPFQILLICLVSDMVKAKDPKPCHRCQECSDYESDGSDSEPDRGRVQCKHCGCKQKDHLAAVVKAKSKLAGGVGGIFQKVLASKTDEEAADLFANANKEAKDGLRSKNKKREKKVRISPSLFEQNPE